MSKPKLTMKKLRAIEEALNHRLAGEVEDDLDRDDYEVALEWAEAQIEKRKGRTS